VAVRRKPGPAVDESYRNNRATERQAAKVAATAAKPAGAGGSPQPTKVGFASVAAVSTARNTFAGYYLSTKVGFAMASS